MICEGRNNACNDATLVSPTTAGVILTVKVHCCHQEGQISQGVRPSDEDAVSVLLCDDAVPEEVLQLGRSGVHLELEGDGPDGLDATWGEAVYVAVHQEIPKLGGEQVGITDLETNRNVMRLRCLETDVNLLFCNLSPLSLNYCTSCFFSIHFQKLRFFFYTLYFVLHSDEVKTKYFYGQEMPKCHRRTGSDF